MANVFEKFGGIRPMADKLGLSWSTVNSWHKALAIPAWRHEAIMAEAIRRGIDLSTDDLTNISPNVEPFRRGPPVKAAA